MADTTLRSLAKAYSKKNLQQAAYREARAKFINGVLSGEIKLTVNDYPPLIRPRADEAAEPTVRKGVKKKTALTESPQKQPSPVPAPVSAPATGKKYLLVGAGIGLLLIVVLVVVLFTGNSDEPAGNNTAPPVAVTTVEANPGQLLIRSLLNQPNWHAVSNLETFQQQWQALSPDSRLQTMESQELNQLTNAIYKQLLVERALSGIGDGSEAQSRQQRLVEFAGQIGISDSRITMPD